MNKTKADIQNNCETHILRIADNIERLLNHKGISLNKLIKSAEIESVSANEKQLFANLIYNFMQKVNAYKTSSDSDKNVPYIAYSTIITLADYLDVPVSELIDEYKDDIMQIPFYNNLNDSFIKVSRNVLNNSEYKDRVFAVKVIDNSMKPLMNINDIVFAVAVENQTYTDGLYIIKNARGYYPKRIIFHNNTVDIISDNPHYRSIVYQINNNNELYSNELNESIFITGKIISFINNSIEIL